MTQPETSSTELNFRRKTLRVYLGSSVLSAAIAFCSFTIAPLIVLCGNQPFALRYRLAKLWVQIVLGTAEIFCGVRYEVEGLENIKDIKTAIVLSKHQSAWETIAFRLFLPPQTAVLKESLIKIPIWGAALGKLRPIAINRGNQRAALKKLLADGKACLDDGLWVVVFPEGTRTQPGETKKFNVGGALLAEKTGYPVIPIAHNAGYCWSRNSFLKFPGVIRVKIGPAIATQNRRAHEINSEAAAWIAEAMKDLDRVTA